MSPQQLWSSTCLLAFTMAWRVGQTFAEDFACETAQRRQSPLRRNFLLSDLQQRASVSEVPPIDSERRMRPGFANRVGLRHAFVEPTTVRREMELGKS